MSPARAAARAPAALAPSSLTTAPPRLQVFAEHLNRAVEQCSKEALEDTLSELSRLPSASAIDLVRSSIEGGRSSSSAAQLAASLRGRLQARTSGCSPLDSPASCSLRTSLTPPAE